MSATSSLFFLSRFLWVPSHNRNAGSLASARAMATRCCSPPLRLLAQAFQFVAETQFLKQRGRVRHCFAARSLAEFQHGEADVSWAVNS